MSDKRRSGRWMIPGPRGGVLVASLAFAFGLAGTMAPARAGLVINATFDSTITSNANAAAIEAGINQAVMSVESHIATNETVSIYFQDTSQTFPGGLGQSLSSFYSLHYNDYYNALKANATSAAQLTALASLGTAPTDSNSGNPVNGSTLVDVTSANLRALGFSTALGFIAPNFQYGGGTYDGNIGINTSITTATGGGPYSVMSTALHEIDEVLGIGGSGSDLGQATTNIGVLDLYRYSAPGTRSYSTGATSSYFSIDGGTTDLVGFNQQAGADYSDWYSVSQPPGFVAQVQDAYATPNTSPDLGSNELTALNVIGYSLAVTSVPEPATVVIMGQAVALLGGAGLFARARSRRQAARGSDSQAR